MRLATQQTAPIEHNGRVIGLNLGFDFAAEHECGFTWAPRHLGRPAEPTTELFGVCARTTTTVSPDFLIEILEHGDALWLRGQPAWYARHGTLADDLKPGKGSHNMRSLVAALAHRPMVAGWDTNTGFCVGGKSAEARAAIQVAHQALAGGRCFILQSGGIFGAGGLKLIDADLIPSEVDEKLRAADLSNLRLKEAVEASGIRARLEAAGRRYFALSPRWEDEAAGTFRFWLNPMEQDRNNYGWFSLADVEAWADGEGPIPKVAAARSPRP